jgi:hypothetical protein
MVGVVIAWHFGRIGKQHLQRTAAEAVVKYQPIWTSQVK